MQYMRKCDEMQRASAGPPAVQFVLEDAESSRPREDVYTMRRKILGDEGCCPHVGLLQAMLDRTRTATSRPREDMYTVQRDILEDNRSCPSVGLLQEMLDQTRTAIRVQPVQE